MTANGRPIPPSSRPLPNVSAAALPYVEAEEDDIPPALTDEQLLDLRHRPNCNCAAHRDRAIVRDVSAISPRQRAAEVAKQKALASAQQPQNAYEHLLSLCPNAQAREVLSRFGVKRHLAPDDPIWTMGELAAIVFAVFGASAFPVRKRPAGQEFLAVLVGAGAATILFCVGFTLHASALPIALVCTAVAVLAAVVGYLRWRARA